MSDDTLGLNFGLTADSQQRFRDWSGKFAHADDLLRAQIDPFMAHVAMEFESHARAEFIAGTDSQGQSHDKSGATLDTFETKPVGPMTYEFTAGLGASFVEFGRGEVSPNNAKVLHWIDWASGEDVFSMYSGPVDPDDFIGRAEEDMDLQGEMSRLALGYFSEMTRTGDYGLGVG